MTTIRIYVGLLVLTIGGGVLAGAAWARKGDDTLPDSIAADLASTSASPTTQTMTIASRVDWPNLARLIAVVDVVAVVRWQGDAEEEVGLIAADGTVKDTRIDVLRSFEVLRVLKGGDVPAAVVARASRQVVTQPRVSVPGGMIENYEIQALESETEYLVFLKRLRPDQGEGFGFWGEPGVARTGGESLEWVVTDAYSEDKIRARQPLGTDGAVKAFDGLTIEDVEQAIAAQP